MTVPPDQRVAPLVGVGSFSAANYYRATANVMNGGTAHTKAIIFDYFKPTTDVHVLASTDAVITRGWNFYLYFSGSSQRWRFVSSGVSVDIATQLLPGRYIWMGSYDGTTARARISDGSVLSNGGGAGFVAGVSNLTLGISANLSTGPIAAMRLSALLGTGSAALSDADMLTTINEIIDNAEQGRSLDAGLSVFVPEDYVDLADAWQGPGAPLKATLNARVGTSSFTKTGEPQAASIPARF